MLQKIFFSFLAVFALLLLWPQGAQANNKIFFVSPTRVALSDTNKVEVINLTNLSDVPRAYEISVKDIVMTEEGITTESADDFAYSAKRLVRYVPRQFVLQPGERQAIRIMARVTPDTPDGAYHSHLMFYEDIKWRAQNAKEQTSAAPGENAASFNVEADYQTLIPVVITHGDVSAQIGVLNPTLQPSPKPNHYEVSMTVTRSGNGQGTLFTETDYIAPDGSVRPATTRRATHIYREVDQRARSYDFALPEGTPASGQIRLRFYDTDNKDASPFDEVTLPLP